MLIVPIHHRLRTIPQHDPPEIRHTRSFRALNHGRHGARLLIPTASTRRASRCADVEFGAVALGAEVGRPVLEGLQEARLADVAVAVVVELHKDKVHGGLHGIEGDGGVGSGTLRRGADVVALGGILVDGGAEGGDESGVVLGGVVFVVDVEAVKLDGAKGPERGALAGAAGEEVVELGGEGGRLAVAGEGRDGFGPAEGKQDFLAGGLAGLDVRGHVRTGEKTGRSLGCGSGAGRCAGAAEVQGWVAPRSKVRRQEGQDDDVSALVCAQVGQFDLTCRTRLSIIDCDVIGAGGVEGST